MNISQQEKRFQEAINFSHFINYMSQSQQSVNLHGIDVYDARINFHNFVCFSPELILNMTLKKCNIRDGELPRDFYMQFANLETIDLSNNALYEINFLIPDRVTYINISGNPAAVITLDIPNSVEAINHDNP